MIVSARFSKFYLKNDIINEVSCVWETQYKTAQNKSGAIT